MRRGFSSPWGFCYRRIPKAYGIQAQSASLAAGDGEARLGVKRWKRHRAVVPSEADRELIRVVHAL